MITGILAGITIALALNNLKTWFDILEVRNELRSAEFELSLVTETIEKLIEERKSD